MMKPITLDFVQQQLASLLDPEFNCAFNHPRLLKEITINDSQLNITLSYPYLTEALVRSREERLTAHLRKIWPECQINVQFCQKIVRHKVQNDLKPKPGIKNIIAVASGKGGVGKSTVAVNLAQALSALGAKVAVLDADIYGPSLPRMVGQIDSKAEIKDKRFQPVWAFGLQTHSMGYLVDERTPMVWRGPMASGALQQLLNDTDWQDCDYMILDLPPGTGDIQLTMAQKIPIAGAVIVTTPQDIALADVYKATKMFEKLEVPVLGVVENMSYHTCSNCGQQSHVFGQGGGAKLAEQHGLTLLAQIPLASGIQQNADQGKRADFQQEAQHFILLAEKVARQLAEQPIELQAPIEKIVMKA